MHFYSLLQHFLLAKITGIIYLPVANEITFGEKEIAEKGTHNSFA
jgi:hypothetical protein